ncbi:MAG: ATP-binding protein, partial [Nitratireductor sp.]
HKAKEAGIVIKTEPVPGDLMVRGEQVRLSQVFVNLISNAVDANIQAGGKNVFVEVAADDDIVRIDVLDEGTGIDQEINSSIFDPFFTTKDVGEGLGLGLSIAYNIIHDFGGTLTARNRNGGGAVFSVTLPRALPMASKSRAAE